MVGRAASQAQYTCQRHLGDNYFIEKCWLKGGLTGVETHPYVSALLSLSTGFLN
jgi:hypothetical protein